MWNEKVGLGGVQHPLRLWLRLIPWPPNYQGCWRPAETWKTQKNGKTPWSKCFHLRIAFLELECACTKSRIHTQKDWTLVVSWFFHPAPWNPKICSPFQRNITEFVNFSCCPSPSPPDLSHLVSRRGGDAWFKSLSGLHLRPGYFNDCTQVFNNRVLHRTLRALFFVFYRETENIWTFY